jgi:hypothetical protein
VLKKLTFEACDVMRELECERNERRAAQRQVACSAERPQSTICAFSHETFTIEKNLWRPFLFASVYHVSVLFLTHHHSYIAEAERHGVFGTACLRILLKCHCTAAAQSDPPPPTPPPPTAPPTACS